MDIIKAATDWAKAEVYSNQFFILFGLLFILAGIGFWQLGKTDLARAYIIPTLLAGVLLMIIGFGLFFNNKSRLASFPSAYETDATAFIESELKRAEATLIEYKTIVFTAIPIIIVVCAIGLIFFTTPVWRASLITAITMLMIILFIDGTASARMDNYNKQLQLANKEMINS